jgi:hypothetical protein
MKKTLKLTEERIQKIISIVKEAVNDYADEDYLEAFLITFRQWITEKLGDESKKYPLSLLLNKYGSEFEDAVGLKDSYYGHDEETYSPYRLKRVARDLVKKGKYVLPNLRVEEKFTEKYKKIISHFLRQIEIPDYVTVKFTEDKPNEVTISADVDFPTMIKQPNFKRVSVSNIEHKLREYLENYVGVEFGNPVYGKVHMSMGKLNFVGLDEWVKNVLNKKIKKDIKAIAPNLIHGIRFETFGGKATLKVVFKDSGWGRRSDAIKKIRDYVQSEGYSPDVLVVEY